MKIGELATPQIPKLFKVIWSIISEGDKTDVNNYRGKSFHLVPYKIHTPCLLDRVPGTIWTWNN